MLALSLGAKSVETLDKITGSHIGQAFVIGLVAGVAAYLLDVYLVQSLETSLGIVPGSL
jgi:hypothetical protein